MSGRRRARRAAWLAAAVFATVLALGLWGVVLLQREAAPTASARLQAAAAGMDEIAIEATLDPAARSMTVTQRLTLTCRSPESRDAVALRTWANAFQTPETSPVADNEACCPGGFSAGGLQLEAVTLLRAGEKVTPAHRYEGDARTLLLLPLEEPWQPGETLQVNLSYTVHFPHAMYRFGWWEDTFRAGHAFAVPALWQDGAYRADEWLPIGEPLSGECCNYTLRLTMPAAYRCAVGGSTTATVRNGDTVTFVVEAPAARDLGLVMSRSLQTLTATKAGVRITACATDRATARHLLDWAGAALETCADRFGAYPWPTYTICALPLGTDGAAYTALGMVNSGLEGSPMEYATAHQAAHQWWYGLVGTDCQTHPWLDEALCEFSLLAYVQDRYGLQAREDVRRARIETTMRITVPGQATPGAPLDYFETETDYRMLVHGRAAAFLCAADELLGGGLEGVLAAFAEAHAFSIAQREDFALMVMEVSGEDIAPLMVDYLDTYLVN